MDMRIKPSLGHGMSRFWSVESSEGVGSMFYGLEIRWSGVHKGCEGEVREAESCEAEENQLLKSKWDRVEQAG